MFILFLVGGFTLGSIFFDWQQERAARQWESFRFRGYEYFHRSQFDDAMSLFKKARDCASSMGKTDYHYALSQVDMARLLMAKGEFEPARTLFVRAISLLGRASQTHKTLAGSLLDEETLAICRLVDLDLSSGKSVAVVWEDCQSALKLLANRPMKDVDSVVSREMCETLMAAGESTEARGDGTTAQAMFRKALEFSKQVPALSFEAALLEKRFNIPTRTTSGANLSELVSNANAALHQHDMASAKKLLTQAINGGAKADDSNVLEAHFLLGKIAFSQSDFEETEKQFLIMLKTPDLLADETKDELWYKLCMLYRQAGYANDLEKALRIHMEIRKKLYGDNTEKAIDIVSEYARLLQQLNKFEEAKPLCHQLMVHYELEKENPTIEAKSSSERVLCVLARDGEKELAKKMLSMLIEEYQAAGDKYLQAYTMANYDLAAIAAMDGDNKECRKYLATADAMLNELSNADKIFASDGLRDWSIYFRDKDIATHFANQTIISLPAPDLRRHALREMATIKEIDKLKRPYNAKARANLQKVIAACKKFPPAKLTGIN